MFSCKKNYKNIFLLIRKNRLSLQELNILKKIPKKLVAVLIFRAIKIINTNIARYISCGKKYINN